MKKNIKDIINEAVFNIINHTSEKIEELQSKHTIKPHFILKKYRVFGGLLQSMNIQFGNFIEELMKVIITCEDKYEIIEEYSGKKSNNFQISLSNEDRIDKYITECQTKLKTNEELKNSFISLQNEIIRDENKHLNNFKHDIDLLFKNKEDNKIYYLEIKYNDDHDTGKFIDINRKFIKTYAYLVKELGINNINNLTPILFFFTNKILKGNIYIPEEINIKRGEAFFNEFLTIKYNELDKYLINISESKDIVKMFDDLYDKVMKI